MPKFKSLDLVVLDLLDLDVSILLVASCEVGLNSLNIDMSNLSILSIEDLSNLLKSRALGLNVEDAHEDKLESDPALSDVSGGANT